MCVTVERLDERIPTAIERTTPHNGLCRKTDGFSRLWTLVGGMQFAAALALALVPARPVMRTTDVASPHVTMTLLEPDEEQIPLSQLRSRSRNLRTSRLQGELARVQEQWQEPKVLSRPLTDTATEIDPPATAGQQDLFRHRFLVSSDLCIRLPIEAATLLRAFVVNSHLSGVLNLQLEAFRPLSRVQFCPDAKRMLSLPNAGGSSLLSEALAFELLARAFGASLERTEMELTYKIGSSMTDFAIHLFGGYPLGVSVTRAYKWRRGDHPSGLDVPEAHRLLVKKLQAINASSRNVQNYRFRKQLVSRAATEPARRPCPLLPQTAISLPSLRLSLQAGCRCLLPCANAAARVGVRPPRRAADRAHVHAAPRLAAREHRAARHAMRRRQLDPLMCV